jgi:putative Mg2+ transporter-C (MgtC) family protein
MLSWLETAGAGFTTWEVFLRLALATVCGLLLGLDREVRGIAAGLRTHAMISLSSAVITLSSFMIYNEVRASGQGDPDPLRVIQGLAQAIGFIGAGAIFVARGNVRNLTTAANMWLAAAVGIAAASGQFVLLLLATIFGVIIITGLRILERYLSGSTKEDD